MKINLNNHINHVYSFLILQILHTGLKLTIVILSGNDHSSNDTYLVVLEKFTKT